MGCTTRRAGRALATAIAACLGIAAAAPTELPPPGSDPWEPLRFRSVERETRYTPLPNGAGVVAESECGASALVLPLEGLDLQETPVLRWRWRVDRPLAIPDERSREGDDFAARVYVMFRFEPEGASFLQRVRQRLGSRLYGTEMPGTALSFVWSSREPPGAHWPNPFAAETRMIALASGPAEDWREEAVDLVAEYRRGFAGAPPPPYALGIMTDADNACQHAVARYGGFRFTPGPA